MHHVETRRVAPRCASVIQGIATNVSFNPLIKRSTFFFLSFILIHPPLARLHPPAYLLSLSFKKLAEGQKVLSGWLARLAE